LTPLLEDKRKDIAPEEMESALVEEVGEDNEGLNELHNPRSCYLCKG